LSTFNSVAYRSSSPSSERYKREFKEREKAGLLVASTVKRQMNESFTRTKEAYRREKKSAASLRELATKVSTAPCIVFIAVCL
jgi:hypothetical protein